MKQFLFLIAAGLLLGSCQNEPTAESTAVPAGTFLIEGSAAGLEGELALVRQQGETFAEVGKVTIVEDKFTFQGPITEPEVMYLVIPGTRTQAGIFMEEGKIQVELNPDNFANPKVTGSATHGLLAQHMTRLAELEGKMEAAYMRYQEASMSGDEAVMKTSEEEFNTLQQQQAQMVKDDALANATNFVGPFLASANFHMFEFADLEKVVDAMSPESAASLYGKDIVKRMDVLAKVQIGSVAPNFTLKSPDGTDVSLESFRGKYLLVDFWASWCVPCRNENPNVVLMYEKFKGKGFEILGVSLDEAQANWTQAIEEDKLTWSHCSDLKGWASSAAALYGVSAIPHTVLIDKDGVIIAKDLRGAELEAKLSEILP